MSVAAHHRDGRGILILDLPVKYSLDWLLEFRTGSRVKHLPCHSLFLSNVSQVLRDLNDMTRVTRADEDGKRRIPFEEDEEVARLLLQWIYDQQKPLTIRKFLVWPRSATPGIWKVRPV